MTDDISDINEVHHWRWLRFRQACRYVGLSRETMRTKIAKGIGPKFYRRPGSRYILFRTDHLDDWIMGAPETPPTERQVERVKKLRVSHELAIERRQARKRRKRRKPHSLHLETMSESPFPRSRKDRARAASRRRLRT